MPARKPEECDTILVDAINKGDLEAAIALYEPNARFVQESGEVVTGHPAIREEMKGFLALKPKFQYQGDRSPERGREHRADTGKVERQRH